MDRKRPKFRCRCLFKFRFHIWTCKRPNNNHNFHIKSWNIKQFKIFQQVFSHDFLIMTLSTEPNHGRKLSLWTVLTLIGSKWLQLGDTRSDQKIPFVKSMVFACQECFSQSAARAYELTWCDHGAQVPHWWTTWQQLMRIKGRDLFICLIHLGGSADWKLLPEGCRFFISSIINMSGIL